MVSAVKNTGGKKELIKKKLKTWLTTYQKKFILDTSKRIVSLKSRRIGLSEAACIKSVIKATRITGHDVHLVSRSFREAKELLRTAAKWARVFYQLDIIKQPHITATKVTFSNGSRIIALPSKAVRSRGGTVILDEAADIQHAQEVYDAVAPAIEADPEGQLILISTPLGKSGLFYEIWSDVDGEHGEWSRHFIDVYDAIDQGADWLPSPEYLKEQYPADVWRQEFCGEFLGDKSQFFSYDLLRSAVWEELPRTQLLKGKKHVLSIDLGASQDASVMTLLEGAKEKISLREFIFLKEPGVEKALHKQREDIFEYVKNTRYDIDTIVVDGAGIGTQLAAELKEEYGANVVTTWDTGDWRKKPSEYVPLLKKELEDGNFVIPGDTRVRDAFAAIQRKTYANRNTKYKASRGKKHGHADLFFATLMGFVEFHKKENNFAFKIVQ